jgi:putative redox protein
MQNINKIKWISGMHMLGQTASGHEITLDGPPDLGGENKGVRPMELLLLGLGGCTTVDVVSTLKKMRQDVEDCQVEIDSTRADEHPKIFTKIHLKFILKGENLDEKKIHKAIELSAEKYCSASIMLGELAEITHSFEVL